MPDTPASKSSYLSATLDRNLSVLSPLLRERVERVRLDESLKRALEKALEREKEEFPSWGELALTGTGRDLLMAPSTGKRQRRRSNDGPLFGVAGAGAMLFVPALGLSLLGLWAGAEAYGVLTAVSSVGALASLAPFAAALQTRRSLRRRDLALDAGGWSVLQVAAFQVAWAWRRRAEAVQKASRSLSIPLTPLAGVDELVWRFAKVLERRTPLQVEDEPELRPALDAIDSELAGLLDSMGDLVEAAEREFLTFEEARLSIPLSERDPVLASLAANELMRKDSAAGEAHPRRAQWLS